MLHTLMKSPFETNILSHMSLSKSSDDFLALQDGVIIALHGNVFLKDITFFMTNLYVIREDVYARGLCKQISKKFVLISYAQFVWLTIKHKQQMIW